MNLGERLKEARTVKGFSQDELAKKIGASRGVITNIEHNKIETPQPMVVNALCNALNINNEWLLHGTGEMSPNNETVKSAKVLAEIYSTAQDLSDDEQLYILDLIKTYKKHMKD